VKTCVPFKTALQKSSARFEAGVLLFGCGGGRPCDLP
jgi:hypothetical protein